MNSVCLIGNLGHDLEIKKTNSGKSVCSFRIAVKSYNTTTWVNIVAWEKIAETACKYLKKGSKVGVSGRIASREYEGKDGKKVTVMEVVATEIDFLDSKPKDGGNPLFKEDTKPKQTELDEPFSDDGDLPF